MHDTPTAGHTGRPPLTRTDSPVVCSYMPTRLADSFHTALQSGRRSWLIDDAPPREQPHLRAPSPLTTGRLPPRGLLVLGHRGANARVGKGGWSGITLGHLALGVITEPQHDEHGLHVTFTPFLHALDIAGRYLCPSLMEALRLSANQWGRPVIAPAWPALGVLARLIGHHPDTPDPDTPEHGELVTLLSHRATAEPGRDRE